TLVEAFVDCGSGAGAVPTGTSSLSGQITIASSGSGGTLTPGAATLLLQLTQGSTVIAVSPAAPVTLVANAVPSMTALSLATAMPFIGGVTSTFSVTVSNPGATQSGVILQAWINQGAT